MNLEENISRIRTIMGFITENQSNDYGFFKNKTNIPDYDMILMGETNRLPKKYEDWNVEIKWVTREEYLKECSKIQGTTYDEQLKYILPQNVDKIEENMKGGVKYNLPYLNYVNKEQEGRHRVIAASNLGQKKIPILILSKNKTTKTNNNISSNNISSMINKWSDLVEKNGDYFCVINDDFTLLSTIVTNYDDYLLDDLFDIKKYPSLYGNNPESFISKKIQNEKKSNYPSHIRRLYRPKPEYDELDNVDDKILFYSSELKTLKNNEWVILDAIKKIDNQWCLKVLKNINNVLDFNDFNTCNDMFKYIREMEYENKFFIQEYNLLPINERNLLNVLTKKDVEPIIKIYGV